MSLMASVERRKPDRVTNEKHRLGEVRIQSWESRVNTYNMVPYNIVIAFLREEFDRKASHIADGVCATLLTASSAQTE